MGTGQRLSMRRTPSGSSWTLVNASRPAEDRGLGREPGLATAGWWGMEGAGSHDRSVQGPIPTLGGPWLQPRDSKVIAMHGFDGMASRKRTPDLFFERDVLVCYPWQSVILVR